LAKHNLLAGGETHKIDDFTFHKYGVAKTAALSGSVSVSVSGIDFILKSGKRQPLFETMISIYEA